MTKIRQLVVRVLKPEEMEVIPFVQRLSRELGSASIYATPLNVHGGKEEAQLQIKGKHIDYDETRDKVQKLGGSVVGLEAFYCGKI